MVRRKLEIGVNDLSIDFPEFVKQWSVNNDKEPNQYLSGSTQKVWWSCLDNPQHPDWIRSITHATRKPNKCPVCTGSVVVSGVSDLKTISPEIAKQWAETNTTTPDKVFATSHKKADWICPKGHKWSAVIRERVDYPSCPYCSGKRTDPGVNDLKTKFPELCEQWSPTNKLGPENYLPFSHQKVDWFCPVCKSICSMPISSKTSQGQGCPVCSGRKLVVGFNDFATKHPNMAEQWSEKNQSNPMDFTSHSNHKVLWYCGNHEWGPVTINDRVTYDSGCPRCINRQSKPEIEIADFLRDNTTLILKENDRTVISPKELDIYISSKNIAIEFNGIYWHTEKYRNKTNHYDKWFQCKSQGIELITIWEDDWLNNPEIVKSMLLHKLGETNTKIGARLTKVEKLQSTEAFNFLDKNHIQGKASGFLYLGLKHENEIVAVAVFKNSGSDILLSRYATSIHVQGGFSKLMSNVVSLYPTKDFVTFADLSVSSGGLYEKTGWVEDSFIKPDYKYLYRNQREHKFNFRLKRFKNDENLKYEEGLTEKQLAELNNIPRIYDLGKIKYRLHKQKMA